MPDIRQSELTQVNYCLEHIIEAVNSYHICNLLIDCSMSVIEVEDSTYNAIAKEFSTALKSTRLKKLAWVVTPKARLYSALRQELNPPIEFKGFSSETAAMNWLTERKTA